MPEKRAIRQLMAEIARADSPHAIYEAALRCLKSTLRVARASMLLLDEHRRMRFVAWSGLSDGYRAAVDGHSPWAPDEPDAETVLVDDVRAAPELRSLLPVLLAEGIEACAFVPLRFGTRLIGKFMLYYDSPHEFSADEVTLAEIVAGHVAFAIEHHRDAAELEERLVAARRAREQAEREAALRQESERRLRLALAAGSMGAWEWGIPTGRVEWSEELERIHGLAPGTFGGTFDDVLHDIHPEDRERFASALDRALENGSQEHEIEYRIVPPDGTQRWVASKGRVVADETGRPVRMVGIRRDVTARKRIEEQERFLAEAGRILATTLEPDSAVRQLARVVVPYLADWCVIQVLDGEGKLTPVELAHRDPAQVELAWRIVRRSRSEHRKPTASNAVLESRKPLLIAQVTPEMLEDAAEDEEHREMLRRLNLRSVITVPLQARGGIRGVLSLGTAESGRIFGEEDLKAAEDIASWAALGLDNAKLLAEAENAWAAAEKARRQLQTLAEISADLASELDPGAALRRLAEKVVESLADYCVTYSYDGVSIERQGFAHRLAEKCDLVLRLADSGPPSVEDTFGAGAVIRTGAPILSAEVTPASVRESGINAEHQRAVHALQVRSAMVVPLRSRGRTVGAITFATTADSERRYDVNDLALALELANRTALLVDNARLYADAKAAIAGRDDMIQVVSHDLRNPLQSIATAAALLHLDAPPERKARSLESISFATAQMNRLLQDLLDISQMDAGRFSVAAEKIDVESLVREAHTLFVSVAEEKSIRLESRIGPNAATVKADRGRIMQVLSNLIGNALKFVSAGGVVTITAERDGARVRFAVADTGVGLAPEDQARVFDRFWRGDRRKERGAGLGLAVAKGIVEAHGGRIGVESSPGQGSTFYFLLDAEPAERPQPARKASPILVVDDDEALRDEIVDLLRGQGYAVVSASNGREALRYLRNEAAPSLVLLDMMMPAMDGWELFDFVKRDESLATVPLVLLTCLDAGDVGSQAAAAEGYLKKPVRLKDLLALAERHCGGSALSEKRRSGSAGASPQAH
ncbi:MAG TPA: GAF domain-containing protein [Gammaproteobacteria bacterium]|nr:GAF domain-containing protein [Gammaproteobacteria bacterium]